MNFRRLEDEARLRRQQEKDQIDRQLPTVCSRTDTARRFEEKNLELHANEAKKLYHLRISVLVFYIPFYILPTYC